MHVLICGGGVIGVSIAYFLSCRGVKATVIEGHWPRLRRLGEVGRVSGARLVRRLAAGAVGAAQLCAACRVGGGDRRGLELSPARRGAHAGELGVLRALNRPGTDILQHRRPRYVSFLKLGSEVKKHLLTLRLNNFVEQISEWRRLKIFEIIWPVASD